MKKLKHLFTALLLLCCVGTATAHEFEVGGIYYYITDDTNKTIEVTNVDEYSDEYTGNVVIPESVTYNGTTYSVTSIGHYAFFRCTGLKSITIPNSVTSIGNSAFYNCTGLTSIEIPNSVTSIGDNAFEDCTSLTNVVIGNSVTSIGDYAFNATAWYYNQSDGVVYAGKVLYKYKGTMPSNTSITIKDGTLGIVDRAFEYCSGLTSIEIPNSVTSIGDHAFAYCYGLTSIEIPNSVTSIGDYAFFCCYGLTSITIPNSVTSIEDYAFYNCTGITSITIPNSVTSIGYYAFQYCTGLTNVVIGNSVTYIGDGAFSGCTGLTSITIPNSVIYIGWGAFENCTGLTSITSLIPAEYLFAIDSDVFSGVDKNACTLCIPYGAKETYATTEGWEDFVNIVEKDFTGIDDMEAEGERVKDVYYDLSGRAVENPSSGIYIINGKKVIIK